MGSNILELVGLSNRAGLQEPDADAIVVENLSKHFKIPHDRRRTVFQHIVGFIRGGSYTYEEFCALEGISFEIHRGEAFGIIGPNGSGKSTLLKIIAGVLYPDTGKIQINGSIAPFLELGAGFQAELSAKENVYLYGAIIGLTRKEINERYDEILDFAELKRFENMKLKNFSSGMYVRLAFSTAVQTNPDIMLVDEVLSVGDEAFQKKCGEKIAEIRRAGATILFVSHGLGTVKELCDRCMLLNHGSIVSIGETGQVLRDYDSLIKGRN